MQPDKEHFRKLIEHGFLQANVTGDFSNLEPYYAPYHKVHTDFHNTKDSHLNGVKSEAKQWSELASDWTAKADHILIDGDMVTVHWHVSAKHHGTHDHNVAGQVKGSGQTVHVSGIIMFKVKDGLVEEEWRYDNILQAMISSGAATLPSAA